MVKVGEPKGILADTLLATLELGDEKAVMDQYIQITTTADSNKYHIGKEHLYRVWDKLSKSDKHRKAADVAACFADLTADNKLWYKMVLSLENLGQLKEAKKNLEILITKEPINKEMANKMLELNEKFSSNK